MTTPENPHAPVIASQADVREALLRAFLANADAGDDAANDEIVDALGRWKRGDS